MQRQGGQGFGRLHHHAGEVSVMRVQLLVSDDCAPCRVAEALWRDVCNEHDASLEIVDLASPAGAALGKSLDIRTLPAVLLDGKLVAVGVQSRSQSEVLLNPAARRESGHAAVEE